MSATPQRIHLLNALAELDEGPDCDPTGEWQLRARAEVRAALACLDGAPIRQGEVIQWRYVYDPVEPVGVAGRDEPESKP